ncbi:MAG: flagellar motor switch protein FliN [Candidatus Krumholzibacteriia bacterium]
MATEDLVTTAPAAGAGAQAAIAEHDGGDAAPDTRNLGMLLDVNLRVTVELGRTRLKIRDILNLATGSVVELGKPASEPVDILVNGALLASGEVVVVDDNFAVRITKLLSRAERLKKLI